MKTVGEILRSARQTKGYSLEKLSNITRIDLGYIKALEEDDLKNLPSATFAKGFIRNLAQALDKNPDELIAIFRRDYQQTKPEPPKIRVPYKFQLPNLLQSHFLTLLVGVVIFFAYLIFQYRAVIALPKLQVETPTSQSILVSPVNIVGKTDPGLTITVNKDLKISADNSGNFATRLNLSLGQTEITISVTNRFGRTTTKIIPVTILNQ